jgi:hypothetical protein
MISVKKRGKIRFPQREGMQEGKIAAVEQPVSARMVITARMLRIS